MTDYKGLSRMNQQSHSRRSLMRPAPCIVLGEDLPELKPEVQYSDAEVKKYEPNLELELK